MSQTKYTLTVTRVLVGGFNTRSFTLSFSEYEKAVASRDMYAADGCSTTLETLQVQRNAPVWVDADGNPHY